MKRGLLNIGAGSMKFQSSEIGLELGVPVGLASFLFSWVPD